MPTKKNTRVQKTKQIPEQDSIKEFYRKILLLQEEERRRISRDLHDETGQMVIALGASLNVLERAVSDGFKDRALNVITDNRKLIQEIATKMKSMALNLRPPTLDILGLSAVLREYFSQCTKSNPVKITFNENIKDIKLDENVEITLYRSFRRPCSMSLNIPRPVPSK
jgi:signal transduction histidine kinase